MMADENENESVSASVEAAFAEHEATEVASPPERAETPAEENPQVALKEAEPSSPPDDETPPSGRDEKGRFAKKDEAEEAPKEEAPKKDAELDLKPPETKSEAPAAWSPTDKEMFAKQTPEAQAFLTRRMGELEKGFHEKTTELSAFKKAAQPFEGFFQQRGISPADAFARLLRVDAALRTGTPEQKAKIHGDLARMYGITIPQGSSEPAQDPAFDGEEPYEDQQLKAIKERQDRLEADITSRRQAEETARVREQQGSIKAFAEEKTEAGELAHPHFDRLQPDMVLLAKGYRTNGQAVPSLAKLYEQASWSNPEVRSELLAAQQTAAAVAEEAERKAHVEKAKAAQAKHMPGDTPAAGSRPKEPKTARDAVNAAWNQQTGNDSSRI